MMALPNIPRLYTALAEWLAVMLYARSRPRRFGKKLNVLSSAGLAFLLGTFLEETGAVPIAWWIPCMLAAVLMQFLYLWFMRDNNWLEAAYDTARTFILAEFAASIEWQLHCWLFAQRSGADPLALALLAAVYAAIYGLMFWMERSRPRPMGHLDISNTAALVAVVMAATVFAVSNLYFLNNEATMSIFYIRTLVDLCGLLILTIQHEQLRENALHRELEAIDNVLHRQYEQYKRSKENIKFINKRYHELKVQIASIRAERDHVKQEAALEQMENGILQYEAENKTGNPVLDTLLTAKSMDCKEKNIQMTSVADGSQVGFLSTRELCSIVGTALDNAIESCAAEPDVEKRLIRTAVYTQNGFLMFRVENYCAEPVELDAEGLPVKNARGGYGLKSLRAAAQQHGGSMTLHWSNHWFTLRVLIPLPEKPRKA